MLRTLDFEEILRILQFGIPVRKGTIYDIRAQNMEQIPDPVFFLSTGRCGTAWFTKLFSSDKKLKTLHNPTPTLNIQSNLAFQHFYKQEPEEEIRELLKEIFLASRESYLRYSFKSNRRIVETNNGITFFAPVLAEIFPTAKFVHLIRDPYEFINSGYRRDYYKGSNEDLRRIRTNKIFDSWEDSDRITKIAWLWFATNDFIHDFGEKYSDRIIRFNFSNNLKTESLMELAKFLGVEIDKNRVKKLIEKPINVQKNGQKFTPEDWSKKQQEQVRILCDRLTEKLNVPTNSVS